MLADLLNTLIGVINYIWPLDRINKWERGEYYFAGWHVGTIPEWLRLVPVLPWFCVVRVVATVPDVFQTEEQTVELQDGSTLTFTASIKLKCVNPAAALHNVVDHEETAIEDAAAILADTLADLPVERLSPEKRRSLLRRCELEVNKEIGDYGMEVIRIRFTNFIRNISTHRLFSSGVTVSAHGG